MADLGPDFESSMSIFQVECSVNRIILIMDELDAPSHLNIQNPVKYRFNDV